MLDPETLIRCDAGFLERIEGTLYSAVSDRMGVDLKSLVARRQDNPFEIRVFHQFQAMLLWRIRVCVGHFGSP